MTKHIEIIGILLMALSLIHIVFPKYFNWSEELSRLSLVNRQMMKIHTFFIGLMAFLMGLLCFTSASELVTSQLGKKISLGMGVFWLIRLLVQFFGYSPKLWKGKTFETIVHIVFTALWIYLTTAFFMVFLSTD